jgi:hypothetical protein
MAASGGRVHVEEIRIDKLDMSIFAVATASP